MKATKHEIDALKTAVADYCDQRGGCCAAIKYRKQNDYAEGFICVHLIDRAVVKVRAYRDPTYRHITVYAFDGRGNVVDHLRAE